MTILTALPPGEIPHDVCIVGTGPVGIALALECERHGLTVLALEAGGEQDHRFHRKDKAEIRDPSRHAPMHISTRCAFGGTSWAWAGGCAPFDDIDFHVREHVPESGWPLAHEDIEPFYARAASIMNCSLEAPAQNEDIWKELKSISADSLLHISAHPNLATSYRDHFRRSKLITLCLNSPAVDLILTPDGERVEAVVVAAAGTRRLVPAKHVVISAGGLRSTQLLLATQRQWPQHFGGVDGPLGRYYMGHLSGWISSIRFTERAGVDYFDEQVVGNAGTVRRRFAIDAAKQCSEKLLNTVFWPANWSLDSPTHEDGTLSMAFLALAIPLIGQIIVHGRRVPLGPEPRRYAAHLWNAVSNPLRTVRGTAWTLKNMFLSQPSIELLAKEKDLRSRWLFYHAEAAPNSESRATLDTKTDRLGLPRLKLDLLFSDADAASVVRAHEVLDEELRGTGKAQLEYWDPPEERIKKVLEQAHDGYHQLGTTRMGVDSKASVVDCDCRVHGVENLFVASSSVFPTAGHAHPTLLAAALAVRLAEHIRDLAHTGVGAGS